MSVTQDWWGQLSSEDYIRTMPNPIPKIKKLNAKYGYDRTISRPPRQYTESRGGSDNDSDRNADE